MDNLSSQLDPYTPPNHYQMLYASWDLLANQTLIGAIYLVYHVIFLTIPALSLL